MPTPVSLQDVLHVLRPWVGTNFLTTHSGFSEDLTRFLQEHSPYRQSLEELYKTVEVYILTRMNSLTRSTMEVMLDNYRTVRLNRQNLEWMTDDVMGVLFDCLTPITSNFEKLNDYVLRMESLSAMRVLFQNFASFFTAEELRFLVSKIREIYPPYRYEGWLIVR